MTGQKKSYLSSKVEENIKDLLVLNPFDVLTTVNITEVYVFTNVFGEYCGKWELNPLYHFTGYKHFFFIAK